MHLLALLRVFLLTVVLQIYVASLLAGFVWVEGRVILLGVLHNLFQVQTEVVVSENYSATVFNIKNFRWIAPQAHKPPSKQRNQKLRQLQTRKDDAGGLL